MKKTPWTALGAVGLLIGLGGLALAEFKPEGTYELRRWGFGGNSATLWVVPAGEGAYELVRRDDDGILRGRMEPRSATSWAQVRFESVRGAAGTLASLAGNAAPEEVEGFYRFTDSGRVYGYLKKSNADGQPEWIFEYGDKGADRPLPGVDAGDGSNSAEGGDAGNADDADDAGSANDSAGLAIRSPRAGAVLVGQRLRVALEPADAQVTVDGPATLEGDELRITDEGTVTLTAVRGQEQATTVLEAVRAYVSEINVLDTLPMADASGPHFRRDDPGAAPVKTPAAVYANTPLRLEVTLKASADLAEEATLRLEGRADGEDHVVFSADVALRALASGERVTLATSEVLNEGVDVNPLEIEWTLGGVQPIIARTPLRVYTTYKAPIKNIDSDVNPPNSLHHFEMACRWARGASKNVGRGRDSIGYQIDNQMRHYVHWKDIGDVAPPPVPDYPEGAEPPKNYDDLPGSWNINAGQRGVSSLYYPPLEPTKDYQKYTHYRNNFGWWVLDNPDYTGGRCNQQAALVCGILGTVGIKARVLYLERTARGKRTGRPIRQYFYAAGGGGPWNFHGVCLADMEDGSQWIYDGSFSSPPRRKNGTREWAENEGGPFIQSFADWYYDDWFGGKVPADDVPPPSEWRGIPPKDDAGN